MVLDTRTLIIMSFLQSIVVAVCLLITAQKGYPGHIQKSMRVWGLAFLIQTAGWLLGGLRGLVPDFIPIILGNAMLVWSQGEIYHALRLFDGQQPHKKTTVGLVVVTIAACLFFLYAENNLAMRILVVYSVSALLLGLGGFQLVARHNEDIGIIRRIVGFCFWLSAAISITRIPLILIEGATTYSLLENSFIQTVIFGGTALGGMFISIGFLLMCNESFNSMLLRLAVTDDLTGLFNHRGIQDLIHKEMEQARRLQQPLSFLMMDADNFKMINDTYGHLAGDTALKVIAETIMTNLRTAEIAGRLGGDEFVVILPNTSEGAARQIAERVNSAVKDAELYIDGNQIQLRLSFGAAVFSGGEADFKQLIRIADDALYKMKRDRAETPC
jgi:diguanylate cyclase (GGDEF)-like protein